MSPEDVQAISDWVIARALGEDRAESLLEDFCERLVGAGLPLLRGHFALRTLHPMFTSVTATWWRGSGTRSAGSSS